MEGIILRKIAYGDSDWILTLFAEPGIRLSAYASKARVSKKRFGNDIDLFNRIRFETRDRASLPHLTSTELIHGGETIHKDLFKFAATCFFTEILLEFLPEHQAVPELYHFFNLMLDQMEKDFPKYYVPLVEDMLLSHFGYQPSLNHCLTCRRPIRKENRYSFSGQKGGILCDLCDSNHQNEALDFETINGLLEARQRPIQEWQGLQLHDPQDKARKALEYFLQFTAGKKFKSLQFLSDILS